MDPAQEADKKDGIRGLKKVRDQGLETRAVPEAGFIGPAGSRIEAVTRRGGVLSTEGMQSSSLRWRRLRARQALRSNFAKFLMPS